MAAAPTIHRQPQVLEGGDYGEPKQVTDLAVPGRDPRQVQKLMRGELTEGEAWAVVDDIETLAATHDPAVAIQGVLGMPVEAAVYMFRVGGKAVTGISAKGARALAEWRGAFRVGPPVIENTMKKVQVTNADNEVEIHEVEGYRATVEVTNLEKRVTFSGMHTQASIIALKEGGWRLDENADKVAASKAERNAILKHFAGVEAMVQEFVNQARSRGDAVILGQIGAEFDAASDARDAAKKHFEVRRSEPLGQTEARVFKAEFDKTVVEAKAAGLPTDKLAEDLIGFQVRTWGQGVKTADVPARDKGRLYEWLHEKRVGLGLPGLPGYGEIAAEVPAEAEAEPATEKTGRRKKTEPEEEVQPTGEGTEKVAEDLFGDH